MMGSNSSLFFFLRVYMDGFSCGSWTKSTQPFTTQLLRSLKTDFNPLDCWTFLGLKTSATTGRKLQMQCNGKLNSSWCKGKQWKKTRDTCSFITIILILRKNCENSITGFPVLIMQIPFFFGLGHISASFPSLSFSAAISQVCSQDLQKMPLLYC